MRSNRADGNRTRRRSACATGSPPSPPTPCKVRFRERSGFAVAPHARSLEDGRSASRLRSRNDREPSLSARRWRLVAMTSTSRGQRRRFTIGFMKRTVTGRCRVDEVGNWQWLGAGVSYRLASLASASSRMPAQPRGPWTWRMRRPPSSFPSSRLTVVWVGQVPSGSRCSIAASMIRPSSVLRRAEVRLSGPLRSRRAIQGPRS